MRLFYMKTQKKYKWIQNKPSITLYSNLLLLSLYLSMLFLKASYFSEELDPWSKLLKELGDFFLSAFVLFFYILSQTFDSGQR